MTDSEDPEATGDRIAALREEMKAAAEALDFDTARRLRDEINLLRGGKSGGRDGGGYRLLRAAASGPNGTWHQPKADDTATRLEEADQT